MTYTSMGDTGVNFRVALLGCLDLTGLDVCMDIIAINFDPFLSQNGLHSKIFYRQVFVDCIVDGRAEVRIDV